MIKKDFKIDFQNKKIVYAGNGDSYSVNELYSFLQDAFDEPENMKYDVPIKANSKTDCSLINGWTADEETTKHLKNGSLNTSTN